MISVVIPAYNEADNIKQCLAAFAQQTYRDKWELILVDNNSTDATVQTAQTLSAQQKLPLRTVTEEKQSIAAARQRGFEEATHDIIATTDADAVVATDWLSTMADYFANDKVMAVSGLTVHKGLWGVTTFNRLFQKAHWHINRPLFFGNNFAVRREAFTKIGGFNTDLYRSEDYDVSLKLGTAFPKEAIHMADDVTIYHYSGNFDFSKTHTTYKLQGFALYLLLLTRSVWSLTPQSAHPLSSTDG